MYEQYGVYWVDLNPTKGGEMNKVRPCVILSPTDVNNFLLTVVSAPITSTDLGLPMRFKVNVKNVKGFVALDQMRALDKSRFCDKVGRLNKDEIETCKAILKEYLID
jgi:mRNA interferase MazF